MNEVKKLTDMMEREDAISLDLLIKEIEWLLRDKCKFEHVRIDITAVHDERGMYQ